MNNKISLTVVITTRNRYSNLLSCLESLKLDLKDESKELIIIDDNSSDRTTNLNIEILRKYSVNASIYHKKKQLMMVKARNYGAKKSKGKLVLFIDDDNLINEKMISVLMKAAEKYKEYGILGPEMCYADKTPYMVCQKFNFYTGMTTRKVQNIQPRKKIPFLNLLDKFLVSQTKNSQEIFETYGIPNVFMIRKKVFEKCGFFDETLIQTFTEMDFSFSAQKFGFKSGIIPKAKTYHQINQKDDFTPRGMGGEFEQKAYCLMRNRSVMVSRYGKIFPKIIYLIFFSWFWPLFYSILILNKKNIKIIKNYWLGFFDGTYFLIFGKIKNSLN